MDPEYKKLVKWLQTYKPVAKDKPDYTNAYLVLSKKLIREFNLSSRGAISATCIPVIIDQITREGRRVFISNEQIKVFQKKHFTKAVEKKLTCNKKDWEHIPAVLLSHRKYALTIDDNFGYDLVNFPKFNATVAKKPENIPYDK
jgi:hypothetical protein